MRRRRNFETHDSDEIAFADPGGRSALRAAGRGNPRNKKCPNCGRKNMLTPRDVALSYVCDICADQAEGRVGIGRAEDY